MWTSQQVRADMTLCERDLLAMAQCVDSVHTTSAPSLQRRSICAAGSSPPSSTDMRWPKTSFQPVRHANSAGKEGGGTSVPNALRAAGLNPRRRSRLCHPLCEKRAERQLRAHPILAVHVTTGIEHRRHTLEIAVAGGIVDGSHGPVPDRTRAAPGELSAPAEA